MIRFVIAFLVSLAVTPIVAQSVKIKADDSKPLNGFSTFYLGSSDVVLVMKRQLADTTLRRQIKNAIVADLSNKGYHFTSDSTGQLIVSFIAEVLEKQLDEQVGPLGQQPADQAAQVNQSQTWTQVMNQTSLSITITEVASGKKVWESSTGSESASVNVEEVLHTAVGRSLRKVPKRK